MNRIGFVRAEFIVTAFLFACGVSTRAQEAYRVEAWKEAVPDAVPQFLASELETPGCVIKSAPGDERIAIWMRKAIPARSKPAGADGAVQFPFLVPGELLGVLYYQAEGRDHRDQSIEPGLYSIRYGLHPVNGDHLGVSPYRDYALLVPAHLEKSAGVLAVRELERESAEASGTNHPAVLLLNAAPEGSVPFTISKDEAKEFWRVAIPLRLVVEGESVADKPHVVWLVFDGVAAQ